MLLSFLTIRLTHCFPTILLRFNYDRLTANVLNDKLREERYTL